MNQSIITKNYNRGWLDGYNDAIKGLKMRDNWWINSINGTGYDAGYKEGHLSGSMKSKFKV